MALAYVRRSVAEDSDALLLVQYMWSDPARWDDWQTAVRRALLDVEGLANPDHDGLADAACGAEVVERSLGDT